MPAVVPATIRPLIDTLFQQMREPPPLPAPPVALRGATVDGIPPLIRIILPDGDPLFIVVNGSIGNAIAGLLQYVVRCLANRRPLGWATIETSLREARNLLKKAALVETDDPLTFVVVAPDTDETAFVSIHPAPIVEPASFNLDWGFRRIPGWITGDSAATGMLWPAFEREAVREMMRQQAEILACAENPESCARITLDETEQPPVVLLSTPEMDGSPQVWRLDADLIVTDNGLRPMWRFGGMNWTVALSPTVVAQLIGTLGRVYTTTAPPAQLSLAALAALRGAFVRITDNRIKIVHPLGGAARIDIAGRGAALVARLLGSALEAQANGEGSRLDPTLHLDMHDAPERIVVEIVEAAAPPMCVVLTFGPATMYDRAFFDWQDTVAGVPGWTNRSMWDGWEQPLFELDAVYEIARQIETLRAEDEDVAGYLTITGLGDRPCVTRYDAAGEAEPEIVEPILVDTDEGPRLVWPIGTADWAWELAAEQLSMDHAWKDLDLPWFEDDGTAPPHGEPLLAIDLSMLLPEEGA